jgi:hypothetical protein
MLVQRDHAVVGVDGDDHHGAGSRASTTVYELSLLSG